jgi:hypothetical protein
MVRRRHVGVALGALASIGACGPSASNYAVERTTDACVPGACLEASAPPVATDAGRDNTPLEPWDDSSAGPMSGVYALHTVVTATVGGQEVALQLLFRLRLLQTFNTDQIQQSTTLCALELPSVKNIATLVLPSTLETIMQQASATVAQGKFLSGTGSSQTYTPPPFLLVLGAKLDDPGNDPLPSLMSLAGEWDEDHDGHPGVTIDATVFTCTATQNLYVALRTKGTLSGTLKSSGTIDGTMAVEESESVLGYSDSCLSVAAGIDPMLSPTAPFHAQRLADESALHTSGNVSCGDIVAMAPMLYGSAWTN